MHQNQSHAVRQPLRSPDKRTQFSKTYMLLYVPFSKKME